MGCGAGFEGTLYLACSNGDVDLAAGTLRQMLTEGVHPSAEALGSVVELHSSQESSRLK